MLEAYDLSLTERDMDAILAALRNPGFPGPGLLRAREAWLSLIDHDVRVGGPPRTEVQG